MAEQARGITPDRLQALEHDEADGHLDQAWANLRSRDAPGADFLEQRLRQLFPDSDTRGKAFQIALEFYALGEQSRFEDEMTGIFPDLRLPRGIGALSTNRQLELIPAIPGTSPGPHESQAA